MPIRRWRVAFDLIRRRVWRAAPLPPPQGVPNVLQRGSRTHLSLSKDAPVLRGVETVVELWM